MVKGPYHHGIAVACVVSDREVTIICTSEEVAEWIAARADGECVRTVGEVVVGRPIDVPVKRLTPLPQPTPRKRFSV